MKTALGMVRYFLAEVFGVVAYLFVLPLILFGLGVEKFRSYNQPDWLRVVSIIAWLGFVFWCSTILTKWLRA